MNEVEFESAPPPQRPRTATVLGLLVGAAAILSYLGAYAMANALVAAEVVKPWPREQDPRFRWFLVGFVVLVSLFAGLGAMFRFFGSRHLKQIDEMEQTDA
jgi:hypothetical protein